MADKTNWINFNKCRPPVGSIIQFCEDPEKYPYGVFFGYLDEFGDLRYENKSFHAHLKNLNYYWKSIAYPKN